MGTPGFELVVPRIYRARGQRFNEYNPYTNPSTNRSYSASDFCLWIDTVIM